MTEQTANPFLGKAYVLAERYINPIAGTVIFNNQKYRIRRKELEILALFCVAGDKLVTRETFISQLWADNLLLGDPGLTRAIGDLRKTIQDNDKSLPIITTLPRKGYQLHGTAKITDGIFSPQLLVNDENTIGPYQLVERISEERSGITYLAKQHEPIHRDVVIKVMNKKLINKQSRAMFESERQALVMMRHPNIVSILDGGQTEMGEPYMVLEYVQGKNISTFCDEQYLSIEDRIKLFLQVCDGILHAHQKGIVHRGINPKSILINTIPESQPIVKIIAFDIAKSLHVFLPNNLIASNKESLMDVLKYISPEQMHEGATVTDTRSDIYSLGILLYELILGTPPDPLERIEQSATELSLENIPIPSLADKLSGLAEVAVTTLCTNRAICVKQFKKIVISDLSWIIEKCLIKDKNCRYASVVELRKDLVRYLERRPIDARGISKRYLARKFIERNRVPSIAIASLFIGLVVSTSVAIVSRYQMVEAYHQSQISLSEAKKATAFITEQIKRLSPFKMGYELRNDLLGSLEAGEKDPDTDNTMQSHYQLLSSVNFTDLSLKQTDKHFIQPALDDIKQDLTHHPLLQATLYQEFASMLHKLSLFEQAKIPQELALNNRIAQLGETHPLTLTAYRNRGLLFLSLNHLEQSINDLSHAFEGFHQQLGADHPDTLITQNRLAVAFYHQGQYEHSLALLEGVLSKQKKVFGDYHEETQKTNNNIGNAYFRLKKYQQAKTKYLKAHQFRRQILGEYHPQTLTSENNLAILYDQQGDKQTALKLYQNILTKREEVNGSHHQSTLYSQNALTEALIHNQRLTEALVLARKTLEAAKNSYGETGREALKAKHNLAWVHKELGHLAQADMLIRDVVHQKMTSLGSNHPITIASIALRDDILESKNNSE
jgi:serine/threonine protein kinase